MAVILRFFQVPITLLSNQTPVKWLTMPRSFDTMGLSSMLRGRSISATTPARGLWEDTAPAAPVTSEILARVSADVAVVGAGYTGLSAALHLAEAGASVAVLESFDVGFGGSGRNVGLVNAGMWVSPDEVCATLGAKHGERLLGLLGAAPQAVFDLIERHGIHCEPERQGTLHCALGRSGLADLAGRAAQWLRRGAPVEFLSAEATARKTGTEVYSGSLWDHRAGTVQPLAYARGLAHAAMAAGVRLFTRSPALRAAHEGTWTIDSERGSVQAPWLIIATDAYGTGPGCELAKEQIHLPYFNLATAPLDAGQLATILPERQGAWDTQRVLCSFRLDRAGRLIFGSIGALEGIGTRIHTEFARRTIRRIFPQLTAVRFEHTWYGNIGMTANRLPSFHRLAPNAIACNGYNGRGIAPGTVFGKLLADHVRGAIAEDDLPLPMSPIRLPALRTLKQRIYSVGAQIAHLAGSRF
jgi:glycine/D-amino acid oxidase-like deaminating enzyme